MKMTVTIDKSNAENTSKLIQEKFKKTPKDGKISKYYGKLKRQLDGLAFQNQVREHED